MRVRIEGRRGRAELSGEQAWELKIGAVCLCISTHKHMIIHVHACVHTHEYLCVLKSTRMGRAAIS